MNGDPSRRSALEARDDEDRDADLLYRLRTAEPTVPPDDRMRFETALVELATSP